jgi:hypothetical protein
MASGMSTLPEPPTRSSVVGGVVAVRHGPHHCRRRVGERERGGRRSGEHGSSGDAASSAPVLLVL